MKEYSVNAKGMFNSIVVELYRVKKKVGFSHDFVLNT